MSASSTAHFRNAALMDGELTGLTITRIDAEKTAVSNSLNAHMTTCNDSETADAAARAGLQTQTDDADTATAQAITNLQQEIDDNETDIEGKLATETGARSSSENAHNTRNAFVDGEISRSDGLHANDSARSDAVEAAQATVDADIEAKIQTRIDQHNADLDDALPRLAKSEEHLETDETDPSNPVVRIKAGVQFEVSGNFIQS
eukprot:jgi/Bigna1/81048/fgenesh1_pg.77_\